MYQQPRHCLLTGIQLGSDVQFEAVEGPVVAYRFYPVGRARIALPVALEFQNSRRYKHPVLAGVCRNAFELNEDPPLITLEFIQHGIKNLVYPKAFKEKCHHLLTLLHKTGSKEFKPRDLISIGDYPLCFSDDEAEFHLIINYLREKYLITVDHEIPFSGGRIRYKEVLLTDDGIATVEKDLPQVPMIGLLNQNITTGDDETDRKSNHAKQLFFCKNRKPLTACDLLAKV